MNGLNINQLNVNLSWYEIMNISVNSLKSNVIGSWINWMEVNLIKGVKPNLNEYKQRNLVEINILWLLYDCWLVV